MRVGIIGSRNRKNFDVCEMEKYLPENSCEIISGGADGIDDCARRLAELKNIKFTEILPDYNKYGKRAPLERNIIIAKSCDFLLAFWDCSSRGTAHTISVCVSENVPFRIIPVTDE